MCACTIRDKKCLESCHILNRIHHKPAQCSATEKAIDGIQKPEARLRLLASPTNMFDNISELPQKKQN